jgi:DNA-binding transcriptional regulator YiaG
MRRPARTKGQQLDLFSYKNEIFALNTMTPHRVKSIRLSFGLTQVEFADLLNIKYNTLRSWEGGYKRPSSPGCALLQFAEEYPDIFIENREKIIKEINNRYMSFFG